MLYGTNVKITLECITVITEKEIAEQNMKVVVWKCNNKQPVQQLKTLKQ